MMVYYCVLSGIGFLLNCVLYYDDINKRGGVLNNVDKGESEEDAGLNNLMASPTPDQRRVADDNLRKSKEGMTEDERIK